jgi:large subunit ribosomal protein L3
MGNRQVTTRNLEVIKVRSEEHLLLIKGAVPGPRSGFVWIEKLERKN